MRLPVYLDHHATTPLDPRVLKAMMPYLTERFGNASSLDHQYGHEASLAVDEARDKIANLVGAKSNEIVFTSGATESDNLALVGLMDRHQNTGNHLITCMTEHKAVLDTACHLERSGKRLTYLPVNELGEIDLASLEEAITDDTVMISIMMANNEVGTIADVKEIGKIAHEHDVLFHTDAAQAVGHIPVDVNKMNIDLMSFSAHKMYGSKGIGALYVRGIRPRVGLNPILHGGGQERNMRSGTYNVPSIVGFGMAAEIASDEMGKEQTRFAHWSDKIINDLGRVGALLNGHPKRRLKHNISISFLGIEGKAVINSVSKYLAISAGSACTTQTVEPSHVLMAMGLGEERAHSSIRLGLGRFNTSEEIDYAIDKLLSQVTMISSIGASG